MESRIGSMLSLIAAIIYYIAAGVALIIGLLVLILILAGIEDSNGETLPKSSAIIVSLFIVIGIAVCIIVGLLFQMASRKMKSKNKEIVKNGATWSLILGIISIFFVNVAGILGIIGGAIGLSDAEK